MTVCGLLGSRRFQRLTVSAICAIIGFARSATAGVLINEIMYHPPSTNALEQWVELYNPGTTNTDLSGWRFSKGWMLTFPTNTVLRAGGYMVIPADTATFTATYPGVTNALAVSAGPLAGHTLELDDAAGKAVNSVNYYSDGDWAARVLSSATYALYGHLSWESYAPHDGLGSSLELINPALANTYAQNWGSSAVTNGTPGGPNSIFSANVAPLITGVAHSPVIPRPEDVVTVSARLVNEHSNGLTATLWYRNASTANPPAFTAAPMFDDGAHNDGLPGDGIFAAILPAQSQGTVVEFYLQASDLEANTRTYPNVIAPTNSLRTANLLYQVDGNTYAGAQPLYRMIMTEMERAELYAIGRKCPDSDSDAQMNATWITTDGVMSGGSTTQLRYNVGVRNRGHGTRQSNPDNYHVNIPRDRLWKGQAGINLNSQFAFCQVLGSAVFRRLGVPMPESRAVQVRINSTNLMTVAGLPDINSFGSYAANEQYNEDFISRSFPLDPAGNAYRGIRDQILCLSVSNSVADLAWKGNDMSVPVYANAYFKENNQVANDFSDLLDLISVLNNTNGYSAANYAANVRNRMNVEEWMQYMAINTLLDNDETCLANGTGDDYALYRGARDTRFLALPYDLDTVLGRGLTTLPPKHSIFRMTALPVMDRFIKTPDFAPLYYKWLKTYTDSTFAPAQMNALLDQTFNGYLPEATIETMKAYNAAQVQWVRSQIPLTLTVSNSLGVQSGYPRATSPAVTLFGTANAVDTRAVLVNGTAAAWVAWQGTWNAGNVHLFPGINRVLVQALDASGAECARTNVDIWYDTGPAQTASGTLSADTTWSAASGPYSITNNLTIANGVTLTIQPGTTVYLGSGVNLTVANGGRILAEGTAAAPIRFTVAPGSGVSWGGLTINGTVGSPETRLAYAVFEGNNTTCIEVAGGTLYLDHSTFLTTTHQYVALDGSSFLISSCYFPSSTAPFELLHGTGGIKAGGRGIVRDCFFGTTSGYNDIMDFTGGNRDLGQPIIQYYNNVFIGASDDILDLDGTDAWIEGNIFLHSHKNGSLDTSSGVSGGKNGTDTSEITIIGNIFYDCDHAAMAKEGNFFTLLNNTIVHQTHQGGTDTDGAVICVEDDNVPEAAGMYLEGNVVYDAEKLVRNLTNAIVTFSNNLLPFAWNGPGAGNSTNAPLLKHIPKLEETFFTTWEQAQVMRAWFSLLPGSPALVSGPNGGDKGGVVPLGASISGEPTGTNNQTSATLRVGTVRTGAGIPVAGWPNGSGYTHYKWRLDGGAWSAETPVANAILLSGLANSSHHVEVTGKRDSGWYQDAPEFGADALVTTSRTWTVDTSYQPPATPTVRLNEILAQNSSTVANGGTPDMVELYNYGAGAVDLSGMGVSDNAALPYKFTFPANTTLDAGQFLVLYADSQTTPGIHLGFSLKASGDDVYLTDRATAGGGRLDSVVFGVQVADLSIGRAGDGTWNLCSPTFGTNNVALELGDSQGLKINEWLADEQFAANNDFVELYNPSPRPVALGDCFLSNAEGAPGLDALAPLSFIAGNGYLAFVADADPGQGADHLNFKLDANGGIILLSDSSLNPIDVINYGPQRTDIAQGRSPSGSDTLVSFSAPTAGAPNPAPNGILSVTNVTSVSLNLLTINTSWKWDNSGGTNFGTTWLQSGFPETGWASGFGLFGYETTPAEYPYSFRTTIPAPNQAGGHITVYYRAHFQWTGALSNVVLVSTNYVDDGAVYYLNGTRVGSIRMPATVSYDTLTTGQPPVEGAPEVLFLPADKLITGDNVMAVEVHQAGTTSSDDVFGMVLTAIQYTTNIITTTTGVPVVLNEVLASNQSFTNAAGQTSDWVELFNLSTNTLNLSDLSLTDDPNQPRKFVFGSTASIGPGGFLVVECDNGRPASSANTGFSLSANGGTLYLFSSRTNGGGLIDAISYGMQVTDYSIGRVPNGSGDWGLTLPTRGAANLAAALGSVAALSVNEWMADPASGPDWFELYNSAENAVALGGLFFTQDLTKKTLSPVPPLSFIGAGANGYLQFIADADTTAGAQHVKFKLSKSGETIGLFSSAGLLITANTFGAQLLGVSQGCFPDGATNVVSFATTASPGSGNYLPLADVVVNEVLSHTDPPLEDAVEFYNGGALPVNIGGWFLSNSRDALKKYRVPDSTTVPAHGFAVLYEYQFNSPVTAVTPFTLNSAHGDQVWLSEASASGDLTGYRATTDFGPAANGVSFGRFTNSIGQVDFVALDALTFGSGVPASLEQFRTGTGAPNAYPRIGPVIFNEIMYYPPPNGIEDNTQDEYLELLNISPYTVALFDPAAPTNTWKVVGGVDFVFPPGMSLAPGESLLLVNFDPTADAVALAEFRSRYQVGSGVRLFGPYGGHLANGGETLSLYRPDAPQAAPHPDAGFVPYILLEQVTYQPVAPWPAGAEGSGLSLQRKAPADYGNDPAHWFVANPTAGLPNISNPLDADNDGLPDAWETQYFGSPNDPRATAGADPDGDGFNNLQEYLAGTDPTNAASALKLDSLRLMAGGMEVKFTAVAGKTYTLLGRSDAAPGAWFKLSDVAPQAQTGTVTIVDTDFASVPTRYYQLVTPALR